jgi:hypothetical protein
MYLIGRPLGHSPPEMHEGEVPLRPWSSLSQRSWRVEDLATFGYGLLTGGHSAIQLSPRAAILVGLDWVRTRRDNGLRTG